MHSVDIAKFPLPKSMSNNTQQRSLKRQLFVWKDCASDPFNPGRQRGRSVILRIPFISFDRVADSSVGLNNPYCGLFLSCRSPSNTRLPLFQAPCHDPTLPTTWRSTTAQGSRVRHLQCKHARLVWSSYLLAGQFKHHLCTSWIWRGQVKGLPREDQITFPSLISTLHAQGSKTLKDLLCLAHMALGH